MKKLSVDQIRNRYLRFFEQKNHAVLPSASLVPENDPTTLFTSSGMQPLVPYLLGQTHAKGTRLVNAQKSFRAEDIDEVGDNRHTTFFEMLGNWSLGDYFKEEQIHWFFEFITDNLSLQADKLYVTVYAGDEKHGLPKDTVSAEIWKELFKAKGIDAKEVFIGTEEEGGKKGMQDGRIFYYRDKNWWSRSGSPDTMPEGEPGGPDSEVFYDFGISHDEHFGRHCPPHCDCGRFLELGNSVFMEYKKSKGGFEKLPKKNVDFGGGLERIAAAVNNDPDVFKTDVLFPAIGALGRISKIQYEEAPEEQKRALRVAADHTRASVFLISDGVLPGNKERGYILRRLIRRTVFKLKMNGITEDWVSPTVKEIVKSYLTFYPEVEEKQQFIIDTITSEADKFRRTIEEGTKVYKKIAGSAKAGISGKDAFKLFSSYGFPFELTKELAKEEGLSLNEDEFKSEFEGHQKLSRSGSDKKFKGGLADSSENTVRLHTVHHLLLRALQTVLGKSVKQRGSNITSERLRLDFLYNEKVSKEELRRVEDVVNEKIQESLPVIKTIMPKDEAEKLGAESEFGQVYPDQVSVYSIGPKDATQDNPKFSEAFSIEFCGGPHVKNTADIKWPIKIVKEEAVSSGIRRIRAVLGESSTQI